VATLNESQYLSTSRLNRNLVVACILDAFSAHCFEPEADFVPLTPHNWKVELSASQPDLLLVESAWRGHQGLWWNTVPKLVPELKKILVWCRERGIPTAFWNKEDPVHFVTFLNVAAEFDSVFTTDMDCVPRYKACLGHDRVYFLPFAAQPSTHNPLEAYERIQGTAFAGAYYSKYKERTADFDALTKTIRARNRFDIYDRNHKSPIEEFAFPEQYLADIVGGLEPDEIGIAYKGYTSNLNLNSVKQSQSMFARRVFELMASNTLVLSNFSRGMRSMFGDLLIATDNAHELNDSLDRLNGIQYGQERIRTAALRKVFTEHTYTERLSYIANISGIPTPSSKSRILIVGGLQQPKDLQIIRDAVNRQTWPELRVALHMTDDLAPNLGSAHFREGWRRCPSPEALQSLQASVVLRAAMKSDCDLVAYFSADDFYGANFLTDAALALTWTSLPAAGKGRYFANHFGVATISSAKGSFEPQKISARASVIRRSLLAEKVRGALSKNLQFEGLSIDPFNYCRGGAGLSEERLQVVKDLELNEGQSLSELRRHADRASIEVADQDPLAVDDLLDGMVVGDADITISKDGPSTVISSQLNPGEHRYIYSKVIRDTKILGLKIDRYVFFECSPGLDVRLAFVFLSASGETLGHVLVPNLTNVEIDLPPGTTGLRVGLRVYGGGRAHLRRFVPRASSHGSAGWLPSTRNLVLTNIYPSYDNLYRNGFIHTRLKAYKRAGRKLEVVIPRRNGRSAFREYQEVEVAEVPIGQIRESLERGEVDNVFAHFLDPLMWEVLHDQSKVKGIYVWMHGSEVQPWWRRTFNYADDLDLERAKVSSEERLAFWRGIFDHLPENVHFVFVSQYFAEEVFEDLGRRLPSERYSIIHNPVDTSVFAYAPKAGELRRRILSIRPYASRKYANDMSVAAVLELSRRDGFSDLQFCFVGDGPLFEETTAPLNGMDNVEIRRGFLNHQEMARIHRDYGVFLTPTRWDSQGVSRDEAMASGLVPVTTAVAAVPEFLDDSCGFMAPMEDATLLADAVWRLANDEELFLAMSEAAARRVAVQTAAAVVVPRELDLLRDSFHSA
jgi:glycosyltransferase involved in cell wall biosynthesis/spore maturation protein CgeB